MIGVHFRGIRIGQFGFQAMDTGLPPEVAFLIKKARRCDNSNSLRWLQKADDFPACNSSSGEPVAPVQKEFHTVSWSPVVLIAQKL